ncbi:PREDICTED: G-protein-signaling modulator 3 isoform X3 [Propithecus coquereli]|uniref:G-protein-signaling modulator 3 isoform X3 n=1 Tax=Propithecus coquereli TaxID=379532 RepID=UPI00063F0905|nr:PREDICTED: G-protein-signaling modulator 3 isoform X3 [Propithecus coquereli]
MANRAPLRMSKAGPLRTPLLGLGDLLLHPLLLRAPATQLLSANFSEFCPLISPALGPRSASLLSLQTELLLDLVAEAQSRRLEEQRATFHAPQSPPSLAPALPRPLEDKEQLYSTILSHQCQRMEAQRSEPPLPPGGQELLELLLRVQGGGRMEEQRSQPPPHIC